MPCVCLATTSRGSSTGDRSSPRPPGRGRGFIRMLSRPRRIAAHASSVRALSSSDRRSQSRASSVSHSPHEAVAEPVELTGDLLRHAGHRLMGVAQVRRRQDEGVDQHADGDAQPGLDKTPGHGVPGRLPRGDHEHRGERAVDPLVAEGPPVDQRHRDEQHDDEGRRAVARHRVPAGRHDHAEDHRQGLLQALDHRAVHRRVHHDEGGPRREGRQGRVQQLVRDDPREGRRDRGLDRLDEQVALAARAAQGAPQRPESVSGVPAQPLDRAYHHGARLPRRSAR